MTTKHTPGPWASVGTTVQAESIRGADCQDAELSQEQHRANARLIAAAPELLEALENVLNRIAELEDAKGFRHDKHDEKLTNARKSYEAADTAAWRLIAKARGE